MRTSEIIIIVILIFLILFFLNNNQKENYNQLVVNVEEQQNNKICLDKKIYNNLITTELTKNYDSIQDELLKENDNSCMCPMDYNPIDCDGRIYDNQCAAKCAGEELSKCSSKTFNIFDNNLDYHINS